MTENDLNVFQAHNIVHQALNAADVPDDVINAWFLISDTLFPHGYKGYDDDFVITFEPDAIVYDVMEEAQNTKPVLTIVPEVK